MNTREFGDNCDMRNAFGCSKEDLVNNKPDYIDNLEYAVKFLNDASHFVHTSNMETVRHINKAKFFILREINRAQGRVAFEKLDLKKEG